MKKEAFNKITNTVKERTGKELDAYQTKIIEEIVERMSCYKLDTVLKEFAEKLKYYIDRGIYAGIRLSVAEYLLRTIKEG